MMIYGWGKSIHGELGGKTTDENEKLCSTPRQINIQFENVAIRKVACGESHTVFLFDNGGIGSCGSNTFGQLGHAKARKKIELIESLSDNEIAQLACGSNHTLVLSQWGDLYSWGRNNYGQLGLSNEDEQFVAVPRLVKSLATRRVVQMACGADHCLVILENSQLFSWGRNDYGQLALGTKSDFKSEPSLVKHLDGVPIMQLSCGGSHCFVVTYLGACYGWGRNGQGQLGLNDEQDRTIPTHLKSLRSHEVRHIACGENHTVILTRAGGVFSFGANEFGQLGHGTVNYEIVPRKVLELMGSTITQIACGKNHTLAYEPNRDRIYSFGKGSSGQLGVGSVRNFSSPVAVKGSWMANDALEVLSEKDRTCLQKNVVVKRIYCGGDQSFVIVTPKKDKVLPDDLRLPLNEGLLERLSLNMAIECVNMTEEQSTPLEVLRYVETVFGSPTCMSASFLLEGDERVPCSLTNPVVDFCAADNFFMKIREVRKVSLLELILESLRMELIPSLPSSPLDVEALRVYLIVTKCHLFDDPVHCTVLCTPFGKALLDLVPESSKVLEYWWGNGMATVDFGRLVTIYKQCLVNILKDVSTHKKGTLVHDKQESLQVYLKVLAKLNRVNNEHGQSLAYEVFYIPEMCDILDVRLDYVNWMHHHVAIQRKQTSNGSLFFCDFPFLFDAKAKTLILQTDAILQMQNAMDRVNQHNFTSLFMPVDPANPYLVLAVNRENVVEDTLAQLIHHVRKDELKKPLKVVFCGEDAVDNGGVRKEFFMLLMRDLIDPKYGMFRVYEETRAIWFNEKTFESEIMFHLIGLLCGLAIYNGNIIDLPFPLALYKKLLGEKIDTKDVRSLSPSLYNSLKYMLEYEADDFEDVFSQYFEISVEAFGQVETRELKPGGKDIMVTKSNREEYLALYVDYLFNVSVAPQYSAFHKGFHNVLGGQVLQLFHAQEMMAMTVGNENYDWDELERNAEYKDEYGPQHPTVIFLWDVFRSLSHEQKKKFLLFLTGYDRIPIFGMRSVKLIIQPTNGGDDFLPAAHTCFNLLDLPRYTTRAKLEEKLLLAIEHTQGFGLA